MTVRRYQATLNRQQDMLLPPSVEDYISAHNPVRAIDAYVNTKRDGVCNPYASS